MRHEPVYWECGEGWDKIIQPLCDLAKLYDCQILQIKEKFGGLRFYFAGKRHEDFQPIVDAAEAASYHTCMDCGTSRILGHKDGNPIYAATLRGDGWWRVLCDKCEDIRQKERTKS